MDNIPHSQAISEENAHVTKNKAFGLLIVIFLLLRILSIALLPNRHYIEASDLTPDNILNGVNHERSLRNLTILNTNVSLTQAAQSKSADMIARKYFAHVDPDGHYIWDKIVADGYTPYLELGENLAIEFYDTDSLMSAWMNSPEHRANILQEGFRDQGMAVSFGNVQNGEYYSAITNTFGSLVKTSKPTTAPVTAKPKPPATTPATQQPVLKAPTAPKPIATPIPTPVTPVITTTTTAQTQATTSATTKISITPRQEPAAPEGSSNGFALPPQNQALPPSINKNSPVETPSVFNQSASGVVGNSNTTQLSDYDINRYLVLICGIAIFLLMISNIRVAVEKKLGSLDKKINNLVILFISLVVIAFMYWL